MGVDYGEILCTAVDEIVTARLQGLSYDITKLCTIVDDSQSYQGKYIVSDGTARYEAYTTDNNLQKGNNVLVTIPNGDYKLQKIIKGRVATTDTTPFKYESPLSKMVKVTENILEAGITESNREEKGLTANSSITYLKKPIYSIEKASQLSGFTRLGISADFRSLLNGYDVVSGTYGLKVLIQGDVVEKPGVTTQQIYELNFNSDDMVGNPYQFEIPFSQEKVFDISFINSINEIKIYFYQGNNFINGSGERISPYFYSGISEKDEFISNNLFVDNVQLFLGYDVNEFKGETLMIHTDDLLSYQYKRDTNEKNMFLRWIHFKEGESPTIVPANGVGGVTDKEVRWYRYVVGTENNDTYGGKNWEKIPSDNAYGQLKCVFTPDVTKQTEQIKAVGIIKEQTDIAKETNEQIYYSNLLVFENEEKVPDQTTKDASMGLSIECLDGSEGNYFVYNQNGKINNEGLGQGYERKFKAMFNGAEITSDIGTLDWIKWYIPAEGRNKTSMIVMNEQQRAENNSEVPDKSVEYRNNDYWIIIRRPKEDKKAFTSNEQSYSISSQWTRQKNNNFVICKVSIDGVEYEATKQLNFGKAGTNGTNLTLVMEFVDNQNALIINDEGQEKGNTINVNTYLYSDSDGQIQPITDTNSIKYSWYKTTTNENDEDRGYIKLLPREKVLDENEKETTQYKNVEVTLQCNTNTIPSDNYYILQAVYNGKLTAYLPIPLKTKDTAFIEGAREIIYDHQGIPSYYTGRYRLHYSDGEKYVEYEDQHNDGKNHFSDWECHYEIESESDRISASYHPALKEISPIDGWGLIAPVFFAEDFENKACVYLSKPEYKDKEERSFNLGWSQPILMMQSKYDFAMLNDWDGSLTLNEENGTILSTMLGAGRKNKDDNTFSGVLIGDVKAGTGLNSVQKATGVYGIHKGQLSYGFRDDGTGFIGKAGQGQILLDGNKSEIKSANYDLGTDGTLFDLDDGKLNLRFGAGGITLQAKKAPYLLIKNSIGNTLINIGVSGKNQENYIQSDTTSTKNSDSKASVKLDLAEGSLDIKSSNMQFLVDSTPSDDTSPYLKLGIPRGTEDKAYDNNLLYVSKNNYYLQSSTYSSAVPKEYDIKVSENNTVKGQCYKYLGENKDNYTYTNSENKSVAFVQNTYFVFAKENILYFLGKKIKAPTEKDKITVNRGKRKEYSTGENGADATFVEVDVDVNDVIKEIKTQCSLVYDEKEEGEDNSGQGFKLDLRNNSIKGYNLYLSGINSSDRTHKYFILDSGANEYPFIVGTNLKIKWDGSIEASNITCYNLTVKGDSNIGGNTKINLGQFHVDGQNGGKGYYGGNAKGVAGFSPQSLSSLEVTVLAQIK